MVAGARACARGAARAPAAMGAGGGGGVGGTGGGTEALEGCARATTAAVGGVPPERSNVLARAPLPLPECSCACICRSCSCCSCSAAILAPTSKPVPPLPPLPATRVPAGAASVLPVPEPLAAPPVDAVATLSVVRVPEVVPLALLAADRAGGPAGPSAGPPAGESRRASLGLGSLRPLSPSISLRPSTPAVRVSGPPDTAVSPARRPKSGPSAAAA